MPSTARATAPSARCPTSAPIEGPTCSSRSSTTLPAVASSAASRSVRCSAGNGLPRPPPGREADPEQVPAGEIDPASGGSPDDQADQARDDDQGRDQEIQVAAADDIDHAVLRSRTRPGVWPAPSGPDPDGAGGGGGRGRGGCGPARPRAAA